MILKTFQNAGEFLGEAQAALEANESANNLMYGLALRLQRYPERIAIPPYFATVGRKRELQVAALMTPPHNLVVLSTNDDYSLEAFDLVARSLRQDSWPVPGVLGPREAALAFAKVWQQLANQPYELNMRERVYELRKVIPPPRPPGEMRLAEIRDLEVVTDWVHAFYVEALPDELHSKEDTREAALQRINDQDFFLWEDQIPVALAGRARPTPNGSCVGPVYTPPEFRSKGYATALTAALSQRLLDGGKKFTALFTNLANPISNSIYQKIGYRPVCDFDLYTFS